MPRKSKGIHTSPEKAGIQNMPPNYAETHKDTTGQMQKLMPIWKKSFENRENYQGKWTEETMSAQIDEYFAYCFSSDVKPCNAGLAMWLGTHKQQIWDWKTHPEKYGFKSELIKQACELIEMSYVGRLEQYPTGNIFLLKSSHGYKDTQTVEFSSNSTSPDEIAEAINKLGLGETKKDS